MILEYGVQLEKVVNGELKSYILPNIYREEAAAKAEIDEVFFEQTADPGWTSAKILVREVSDWKVKRAING